MAKNVVAIRVDYLGSAVRVTPLARTDRGTRYMVPGDTLLAVNADGKLSAPDSITALSEVVGEPVIVGS